MRKAKSTKSLIFLGIIGASVVLGLSYLFYHSQLTDRFVQEGKNKKYLLDASQKVWEVWRKGVHSQLFRDLEKECSKEKFESKLSCNRELLKCVLKNAVIKPSVKGAGKISFESIEKVSNHLNGKKAPDEGLRVVMSFNKTKLTVFLEDSCEKLFLPKRIYGFGSEKNPDRSKRFDNFKRLIFIDKEPRLVKGKTREEMSEVCSSRSMQLLESHLLDAASFHPVDLKNNRPQELLRPPLPWSRYFKSEFLYKAEKDKKLKFDPKYCDYLFSKECIGKTNTSLPSWMGIRDPLGGSIEVVRNVVSADKSIHPSSKHFSIHSLWHRLGLRALWNGKTFDTRDFNFGEKDTPSIENFKDLEMGFRCMKEVWQ